MADLYAIAREAVEKRGAMQKPAELAALLGLVAALRPKTVWEVGSGIGGTLWALDTALSYGSPGLVDLVAINLPYGPYGGSGADILAAVPNPFSRLSLIEGDSLCVELPGEADVILIDADHSEVAVRADFGRYWPRVRAGGFLALHDVLTHPPETGVEVDLLWADLDRDPGYATVSLLDCETRGAAGNIWGGIGIVFR